MLHNFVDGIGWDAEPFFPENTAQSDVPVLVHVLFCSSSALSPPSKPVFEGKLRRCVQATGVQSFGSAATSGLGMAWRAGASSGGLTNTRDEIEMSTSATVHAGSQVSRCEIWQRALLHWLMA